MHRLADTQKMNHFIRERSSAFSLVFAHRDDSATALIYESRSRFDLAIFTGVPSSCARGTACALAAAPPLHAGLDARLPPGTPSLRLYPGCALCDLPVCSFH